MKKEELNGYTRGAIKRKLKIGRNENLKPGDLIRKANSMSKTKKVSIMGLV